MIFGLISKDFSLFSHYYAALRVVVFSNPLSDLDESKVHVFIANNVEAVFFIHWEGIAIDIGFGFFLSDWDRIGGREECGEMVIRNEDSAVSHLEKLYTITEDVKVADIKVLVKRIEFVSSKFVASFC